MHLWQSSYLACRRTCVVLYLPQKEKAQNIKLDNPGQMKAFGDCRHLPTRFSSSAASSEDFWKLNLSVMPVYLRTFYTEPFI